MLNNKPEHAFTATTGSGDIKELDTFFFLMQLAQFFLLRSPLPNSRHGWRSVVWICEFMFTL